MTKIFKLKCVFETCTINSKFRTYTLNRDNALQVNLYAVITMLTNTLITKLK